MSEYEKGKIVVTFFSEVPRWRIGDLCGTVRGKVVSSKGADNSFIISVPSGKEDEAARRLRASPHVLYAERVVINQVG